VKKKQVKRTKEVNQGSGTWIADFHAALSKTKSLGSGYNLEQKISIEIT